MASEGMLAEWSKTDTKVLKFRKEWTIMNVKDVPKDKDHVLDRISSKNPEIGDEWYAIIKNSVRTYQSPPDYSLSFFVTQSNTPLKIPIMMRFRFMILTKDTVKVDETKNDFYGTTSSCEPIFQKNVDLIDRSGYLINGNLTIACEITIVTNQVDVISYMEEKPKEIFRIIGNDFSRDMEEIFNKQKSGDFTFKFGDKNLRASRNILTARSPVFAKMFKKESKFKENQDKCVDILDIDYEVFREMLFYIYTDRVPKLLEMAEGLLAAAEKYDLKYLKIMCEKAFWHNISIDNAINTLIISDKYKCSQLKFHTIGYFVMHKSEIMKSDAYESLLTTDSARVKEILCEVFDHEEFLPKLEINEKKMILIE